MSRKSRKVIHQGTPERNSNRSLGRDRAQVVAAEGVEIVEGGGVDPEAINMNERERGVVGGVAAAAAAAEVGARNANRQSSKSAKRTQCAPQPQPQPQPGRGKGAGAKVPRWCPRLPPARRMAVMTSDL